MKSTTEKLAEALALVLYKVENCCNCWNKSATKEEISGVLEVQKEHEQSKDNPTLSEREKAFEALDSITEYNYWDKEVKTIREALQQQEVEEVSETVFNLLLQQKAMTAKGYARQFPNGFKVVEDK